MPTRAMAQAALAEREELILRLAADVVKARGPSKAEAIAKCRASVADYRTIAEAWNAAHPEAPIVARGFKP